jgi:ABC-2 type transport system ATP-binding protein
MIHLKHVTKLYGRVIGSNDLTIELEPGAYGVVGPNGAGKTTLINLLTGQLQPTIGKVRIFDINPWHRRSVLRRIGLCPASDVLYPNVSALEWVTYQVRLHGFSRPESRRLAVAALEQTGMSDRMKRPMGTYSLGMRQRTKIAQAIAHEPDLLILDEPYNGLDPVGRFQMTELLQAWSASGKSLLFASHVLHEIEAITTSFLLIYRGRLLASGKATEIDRMLADSPQQIEIRGPDVSKLIHRLAEQSWVNGLTLLEDRTSLQVTLRDPRNLYDNLANWIRQDDLRIDQLRSTDGNLSAIFEALLRQHRGHHR